MPSKPLATRLREKRNSPPQDEPWIWLTRELIESEAWRSLSRASLIVVFRVMLEHMAHGGTANRDLIVTYSDFVKHGIRRQGLPAAIEAACERGLIIITERGRRSTGPDRWPTRYALGWLPMADGSAPSNRWKDWRLKRSPRVPPIPGNIESSTGNGTRENGGIIGALVPKTPLAPGTVSGTGEGRKSANRQ